MDIFYNVTTVAYTQVITPSAPNSFMLAYIWLFQSKSHFYL